MWNVKTAKITPPKDGSIGTMAMVEPLRDRLLALPRESEWDAAVARERIRAAFRTAAPVVALLNQRRARRCR